MFARGDYIVHPGQGVCEVADLVDGEHPAYKLMPIGRRNPMMISFPVENEGRLRSVLSSDEAEALIAEYVSIGTDDYVGKSAAVEELYFKDRIKQGSCRDAVCIVKTFRQRIADLIARNKKPPVAYERILKEAQTRSLSELAVALKLSPEEVVARFEQSE